MEIETQILNRKQVIELIQLGFDIDQYATFCFDINDELFIGNSCNYWLGIKKYKIPSIKLNTLTVADILNILPSKLNEGEIYLTIDKNTDNYIVKYLEYFTHYPPESFKEINQPNLIDALFEMLKWCIQENHIQNKVLEQ